MCSKCKEDRFELLPELESILNEHYQRLPQRAVSNSQLKNTTNAVGANIKRNDRNLPHFIGWAKKLLNKLLGLNIPINGNIDVQTQNAIQNFQRKNGLKPNGVLNYRTLLLLHTTKIQPPPEILSKQRYILGSLLPNKIVSANKITPQSELQFDLLTPIATGIGIVKSIVELEKDVIWYKEELKREAIYPFGKNDKYNKPPWKKRTFEVKQSLQAMVHKNFYESIRLDVVYATFTVNYHYNGNAIGYISLDKIGADCGTGNSLVVEQSITPDPNTYAIGKQKPLAMIEVSFTYTFKSIFSSPAIWLAKFQLYGNGTMATENKWTQGRPELAFNNTERSETLIGKKTLALP